MKTSESSEAQETSGTKRTPVWIRKQPTLAAANSRHDAPIWNGARRASKKRGARKTVPAPTAVPNIASETAMNAK
jgi:hypothetical protein